MKTKYRMTMFFILFSLSLSAVPSVFAQTPESFFPHHVGDRWDYWHSAFGYSTLVLSRDSIGADGSHYLFYGGSTLLYKIDTLERVFFDPTFPNSSVLYYLAADSGFVWQGGPWGWAWVAKVESALVFGNQTVVKTFRYNPAHPDTTGWDRSLEEHRLARGFGKIHWEGEPSWVEILTGCIIAGDTFGFLTSAVSPPQTSNPAEYGLRQNFPNPFNPLTNIVFELPTATYVVVHVVDILGREVANLVNARMDAGNHQLIWNAADAASGLYFCRMQANGNIRTIKMLLTK